MPEYQNQGVGSKLLCFAKENTPTMLYFGSQPEAEGWKYPAPNLNIVEKEKYCAKLAVYGNI